MTEFKKMNRDWIQDFNKQGTWKKIHKILYSIYNKINEKK